MESIAIDVGSGMTKVKTAEHQSYFRSIVGIPEDSAFEMGKSNGWTIKQGEKKYVTGEKAVMNVSPENHINTQHLQWFSEEGYKMLLYSAVAAAYPEGFKGSLRLCTGLPVEEFTNHRCQLEEILNGKHTFRANDVEYCVHFKKRSNVVMPQPYGLYVKAVVENESWSDEKVGVLDIGSYTSDWTIIEDLKVRAYANGGAKVGVWTIVNEVKDFLGEQLGVKPGTQDLLESINGRTYRHQGRDVDLNGIIDNGAMKGAEILVDKINESFKDPQSLRIVVGGGGSTFFGRSLKMAYPHAVVLDDEMPFMSIVEGYYKYLSLSKEKVASNG